jgi:hypothetical protein
MQIIQAVNIYFFLLLTGSAYPVREPGNGLLSEEPGTVIPVRGNGPGIPTRHRATYQSVREPGKDLPSGKGLAAGKDLSAGDCQAAGYPGDSLIGTHPEVLFHENFEAADPLEKWAHIWENGGTFLVCGI